MNIIIEKELDKIWGIDSILDEARTYSWDWNTLKHSILILVRKDISEIIDGAHWSVKPTQEELAKCGNKLSWQYYNKGNELECPAEAERRAREVTG